MSPTPGDSVVAGLSLLQGAREAQLERDRVALRALVGVCVGLGALSALSVPVQAMAGHPSDLSAARMALAGLLWAAAVLAAGVGRRAGPRVACAGLLVLLQVGFAAYAALTGLGLFSIMLAASAMLLALAGPLVGPAWSGVMGVLQAVILVLLWEAERSGAVAPLVEGTLGGSTSRAISHGLLSLGSLLVGLVMSRQVVRSLHQAWQQEHRLAELLRLGSDWTWEGDRRGRIRHISDSFVRHTGRQVAEFLHIGQPGGPQPLDDADWAAMLDDMRARRAYRNRTVTFTCADGTVLVVRGSGEPVFDAAGKHVGWWGICQNVTAEVLASRALAESRAMLDNLVQLTPDAITVASLRTGHILLANPGFLAMAGYDRPEQVLGQSGQGLGLWRDPADAERLRLALDAPGGVVRGMRSTARRPDGAEREVMISAARFDWAGEPVAVILTRDITEDERARLQGDAILQHAAVGVALVRGGVIERANPRLEQLLGQPAGSMAGQPVARYFGGPAAYERFIATVRERLQAGHPVQLEHPFLRPDGSTMLAELRSELVDPRRPEEGGAIWVLEDITERRRAEQALAEAKAVAEAASAAKSAFLAHVSHEIRTPLNGVLGLARLMATPGQSDARRQAWLRYLIDAAESLNGIVSNVLDLSKLEARKLTVEHIAFDLHALLETVHGAHAVLAEAKGLQLRLELPADVPVRVLGDPLRLRQILSNFLANAIKFTAQGEVVLRVAASGAGGALRFEVEDTGIGIPPEVLPRLFRPFAQADDSTTRRYGGTGLGLSIAHELAQLMGGEVGAHSRPQGGAVFWLALTLPEGTAAAPAAAAEGAAPSPAPAAPGASQEPQPLRGLRVLVAEDHPVNMLIATELLSSLGAQVTPARDGGEAVRLCLQSPDSFDVVLMDLHMPVLDGLAAVRALRRDARTASLPVVAFSAAALDNERALARAAGMNGFLAKPMQPQELVRLLARWVPAPAG
ncbi:ATP-binding protein [Ideonella sp.]|uniref:ATP-binding protein n=1 Tax=Ideonella sp. TaxID=1929293 RepID=UPI0035B0176A